MLITPQSLTTAQSSHPTLLHPIQILNKISFSPIPYILLNSNGLRTRPAQTKKHRHRADIPKPQSTHHIVRNRTITTINPRGPSRGYQSRAITRFRFSITKIMGNAAFLPIPKQHQSIPTHFCNPYKEKHHKLGRRVTTRMWLRLVNPNKPRLPSRFIKTRMHSIIPHISKFLLKDFAFTLASSIFSFASSALTTDNQIKANPRNNAFI